MPKDIFQIVYFYGHSKDDPLGPLSQWFDCEFYEVIYPQETWKDKFLTWPPKVMCLESISSIPIADLNEIEFDLNTPFQFKEPRRIRFFNAEQYMMFGKAIVFSDAEVARKILANTNARKVKGLGRMVNDFSDREWNLYRSEIVQRGNYLKFSQNVSEQFQDALFLSTKLNDYYCVKNVQRYVDSSIYESMKCDSTPNDDSEEITAKSDVSNVWEASDVIFVEASPTDRIWGIGISVEKALRGETWKGSNLLGNALTNVRNHMIQGVDDTFTSSI